jgi:hypothetical protein
VAPFKNCVRHRRPVSKMAAITKNRNLFKWPKLLYFKKFLFLVTFQQSLIEIGSVVSEEKIFF